MALIHFNIFDICNIQVKLTGISNYTLNYDLIINFM